MPGFDVVVIGVGCMGSATCRSLAERGLSVLGLERHEIPHDLGSSGHQSRAFRLAYSEHPDYVPLLKAARRRWLSLNAQVDEPVFFETGGLYAARTGADFVQGSRDAAVTHSVPHQLLTRDEVHGRWPAVRLPDDHEAMFEPGAGMVIPERAIAVQVRLAREAGAEVRSGVEVRSWTSTSDGVAVETSHDTIHADHLVVCAGAWSQETAPLSAAPIRPSRQVLGWVAPRDEDALKQLPVWAFELEDASILYGFPLKSGLPGPIGFKAARHWAADTVDPDTIDRAEAPRDRDDFEPMLRRFFPDAVGEVTDVRICMYANSVDGHFVVDRHPEHDRVTIAAGFSGHGFKFAPVMGEAIADLAVQGRSDLPVAFLGLDRFA